MQYARARARWAGGRNLCSLCCEQRRDRWPSVHRQARDFTKRLGSPRSLLCRAARRLALPEPGGELSRLDTPAREPLAPGNFALPGGLGCNLRCLCGGRERNAGTGTARAYSTPRQREPGIFGARSLVECPRRSEHRLLRIRLQPAGGTAAVPNDAWSRPQPRAIDRARRLDTVGRFIVEHAIEKFIDLSRRVAPRGSGHLRVLALSCMSRTGTLVDPLAGVCGAKTCGICGFDRHAAHAKNPSKVTLTGLLANGPNYACLGLHSEWMDWIDGEGDVALSCSE